MQHYYRFGSSLFLLFFLCSCVTVVDLPSQELSSDYSDPLSPEDLLIPENVSDAELVWLYKHAVCNILPSYDEGFGLSYLEAASYETPSVLSDISVFHEIARDSALFVDPEKPKSISDAITLLSTNAQRRQDLGKKAKERSVIFSPEKFKDHFQSSINDL